MQSAWQAAISAADNEFKRIQRELRAARDQLHKLRALHDAELGKLGRQVFERQLTAFLETRFISDARIEGVGAGRAASA